MNTKLIILSLVLLYGCASYKELQPIPEITPSEGLYQSIKNKDDNFLLEKGSKYFIRFPRPTNNDYYLVLSGLNKRVIYADMENYFNAEAETVLTKSFGFKEGGIQKIPDESSSSDSISLFAIDSMSAYYTLKIDTVKQDHELSVVYRYVYQWRYIFESNYKRFKNILDENIIDRTMYNSINNDFNFDNINTTPLITNISPRISRLKSMQQELLKLENVFPSDVKRLNEDTAYSTYTGFRSEVDDELNVQSNFLDLLIIIKEEKTTQGNTTLFLGSAPLFTKFVVGLKNYPIPIIEKVKKMFSDRLNEVIPYYESMLKKNDINAIGPYPELENAEGLFQACNKEIPYDYGNMRVFVKKFVEERDALNIVESNLTDLNALAENVSDHPSESFYKTAISIIEKTKEIIPESEARRIEKYGKYKCAILLDQRISNASKFIDLLKDQIIALQYSDNKLAVINNASDGNIVWPPDTLYKNLLQDVDEVRNTMPKPISQHIEIYGDSKIGVWANRRVSIVSKQINELQPRIQRAAVLVPQINILKASENYNGIIKLLNANRTIGFLVASYQNIDSLSLYNQSRVITNYLNNNNWNVAESRIANLFRDKDYLNYSLILDRKNKLVKQHEEELFQSISKYSKTTAEGYINNNISILNNVPMLYKDSAFIPTYHLKFSSTSEKELNQKNKQIEKILSDMKTIWFPESAIKTLYKELTQNTQDQGVQKARAIVEHSKYYKGTDKQIQIIADECNYSVPKSIVKPSEYRKVFALPVTSNKKGSNDYLLRLKLNIPSDAEFPVFDVNITVPQELTTGDENASWFDEITINKKLIKNEGRFHITAPNSSNNYESQITPVQIDKSIDNIFEIKFKYAGFRIFEISAMVQKPILRKN